jgi:hypothetical protein
MPKKATSADLIAVVKKLATEDEPIVSSDLVRGEWIHLGVDAAATPSGSTRAGRVPWAELSASTVPPPARRRRAGAPGKLVTPGRPGSPRYKTRSLVGKRLAIQSCK